MMLDQPGDCTYGLESFLALAVRHACDIETSFGHDLRIARSRIQATYHLLSRR